MRVLVIGSGGREHALVWKLAQSPQVTELYCAPGNPGMAGLAVCVPIAADAIDELCGFAADKGIDLTVPGPELPLSMGLVDVFQKRGLAVFGPTQAAAQLESSKVFSKRFMLRHGIPTAEAEEASSLKEAVAAAERIGLPLVLKADGLAAGKGVLIIRTQEELAEGLAVFFAERRFGTSGDRILVEACIDGEEVSYMGLSDGKRILPLATSKDYKRIGEDDSGPNTGGMGAHSPSGVMRASVEAEVLENVMQKTVDGMAADGHPVVGVIYAGLMLTADGPRVLEYNIRFGDPECQALLPRFEDDLAQVLLEGARGSFDRDAVRFSEQTAACVVLASRGYPEEPIKGEAIRGLEGFPTEDGTVVFHSGTRLVDGKVVSAGGRVLSVCALGEDLGDALRKAYSGVERIDWPAKIFRRDIGRRVLTGTF